VAKERTIRVALREQAYDVIVRRGLLADVGSRLRKINTSGKAIVFADSNVPSHFHTLLRESLESEGFSPSFLIIPAGEESKSIEHVVKLYDLVLPLKLDRQTPLLALGGGVIGDITGFVAATVLRGVPFAQVPTTLLAMVDASVGGKTGVNHAAGKNMIGSFHQPIAVFVDPDVLRTLPPREMRGGLAECIKHEIIRDAEGFAQLEANIARALSLDLDYLADLIAHNVAIKAKIVTSDPLEKGERAHLNFGHTFGHAIETVSKYSYSHGECVALGMTAAAKLARELSMIDEPSRGRIVKLIAATGLPTAGLTLDPNVIIDAMAFDKKVRAGRIRFILPDRIGHVVMRDDVPVDEVREAVLSVID
jgi:3-dehydroquinate synthase